MSFLTERGIVCVSADKLDFDPAAVAAALVVYPNQSRSRLRVPQAQSHRDPLREFARFCVMREDRKRANIWWAEGASKREF